MNRRTFLGTSSTLAAAGLASQIPTLAADSSSSTSLVTTPLVLMSPTPDGFDAVWGVGRLSKGQLFCEDQSGQTTHFATDRFGFVPQGDKTIKIRVRGLKPGAKYRVKAITTAADNAEQHSTEPKDFRTLDSSANSTEFVVWNDTHIHNQTIQQLHEITPPADFLLWNGDTCNDWKSPDLLVPTLLNPGERDITKGRPLLLTWGNHDVRGPHAFQKTSIVTTPEDRPFYAFRSGPLAVICLHTGEDKPDSHPSFQGRAAFDPLRQTQAAWLRETIQRPELRDAPYRIVFCHIPLRWRDERPQDYATGGFDRYSLRSRQLWHSALTDWKTQLIISGHTHQPAWLPPSDEFPYGQLIGGGPQPKAATWMHAQFNQTTGQISVQNLEGATLHEVDLRPLG